MWNEHGVAGAIIELGKKMLNLDTAPDNAVTMASLHLAAAMATSIQGGVPPTKKTTKKRDVAKKSKGGKGGAGKGVEKEQGLSSCSQSEELKALEAYILKLSQQGGSCRQKNRAQRSSTNRPTERLIDRRNDQPTDRRNDQPNDQPTDRTTN